MTEYGTIIITSAATLVIAVVAGLVVEFVKRIKPKIVHSIREAIPIDMDDNKIGANVVYLNNPSSKTVKDIKKRGQVFRRYIRPLILTLLVLPFSKFNMKYT